MKCETVPSIYSLMIRFTQKINHVYLRLFDIRLSDYLIAKSACSPSAPFKIIVDRIEFHGDVYLYTWNLALIMKSDDYIINEIWTIFNLFQWCVNNLRQVKTWKFDPIPPKWSYFYGYENVVLLLGIILIIFEIFE